MNFPYDPLIRDIEEFPDYQISEDGTIYNRTTGNEVSAHVNQFGYLQVNLKNNTIRTIKLVHRLLAIAFIGNPNPEKFNFIDHIDRDRQNNKLENLRWVSRYENAQNIGSICTNTSGYKGVRYYYRKNRDTEHWLADISAYGKRIDKKFPYNDEGLELAKQWRLEKEKELFFKQ